MILLLTCCAVAATADTFRVSYSIRGSGRKITVRAESSSEAGRVVMEMFPGAVVTGVSRVKKAEVGRAFHGGFRSLPPSTRCLRRRDDGDLHARTRALPGHPFH
jgi:hypothetical protein